MVNAPARPLRRLKSIFTERLVRSRTGADDGSVQPDRLHARNNFNTIRTVAALAVVCAHSSELSRDPALLPVSPFSLLAVQAFFVISGYLIAQSYVNTPHISTYFIKRVLRIYPAYLFVVLGFSIVLFWSTELSFRQYFGYDYAKYLSSNLIYLNFLQPTLPGVFANNPAHAVNGALWTLKVEVAFYIFVPLFVFLFDKFGPAKIISMLFVLSVVYYLSFSNPEMQRQFPGQMTYFLSGMFLFIYSNWFKKNIFLVLLGGTAIYYASFFIIEPVIRPIGIAALVFAFAFGPYADHLSRYGDPSYGIYILHFPIIQLLVQYGFFANPWQGLALTLVIVVSSAFALWHLVEKQFLRRRWRRPALP